MKIQFMSDLHLEFGPIYPKKKGDILLLAGDIMVADFLRKERTDKHARKHRAVAEKFFHEHLAQWDKVYYIPGNHEHYHGEIFDTDGLITEFLNGTNVEYAETGACSLGNGVGLLMGTLWTDLKNSDWFVNQKVRDAMADYGVIQDGGIRIRPDLIHKLNRGTRKVFRMFLDEHNFKQWIVMTHHGPLFPPQEVWGENMGGNDIDYAYFNLGMDWLMDYPITHIIHGHTHDTYDWKAGDIRILTNPRGYVGHELNPNFDEEKVIELV